MKRKKYLFVFLALSVLLGACSKEDDPAPQEENLATYSIKIEFDKTTLNPEWTINLSGYYYHQNKDLEIKGYEFWKELDTEVGVNNFYGTSYFSDDQLIKPSILIEFDQKAKGLHFTLKVKGEEEEVIKPAGKVFLLKESKPFKEYSISQETSFVHQ